MSDALPYQSFPRGALLLVAGLVGLSLLGATVGRFTGPEKIEVSTTAVASRDLLFVDQDDGGVSVVNAATGRVIEVAQPGTNGFLRALLRGLAQSRLHRSIGAATPFHLTYWADGRLTLDDPDTGRRVELEAFGGTNAEVFGRLLTARDLP